MEKLKRMYWGVAAAWFAMGICVCWMLDKSPVTIAIVMVCSGIASWFINREEKRK